MASDPKKLNMATDPRKPSPENGFSGRPKLAARLHKIGSWDDAAYFLRGRGVKITGAYLSMLSLGKKDPSLKLAKRLAEVLEIKFMDVVGE